MDIVFQATEETVWDRAEWSDAKEEIYLQLKADTVDYVLDLIRKGERPDPTIGLDLFDEPPPYSIEPPAKWLMVSRITRTAETYYVTATYFGASCRYPNRNEEKLHGSLFDREEYVSAWCNGVMTARPKTAARKRKRKTYNELDRPGATMPAATSRGAQPSALAPRSIYGVLATKGGVGKTMLSLHLAIASASQRPVIILDLDTGRQTSDELEAVISFSRPELEFSSKANRESSDYSNRHRRLDQPVQQIGLGSSRGQSVARPAAVAWETVSGRDLKRRIAMKSSGSTGGDQRTSSVRLQVDGALDNAKSGAMEITIRMPFVGIATMGYREKSDEIEYGRSEFSIRAGDAVGQLGLRGVSTVWSPREQRQP